MGERLIYRKKEVSALDYQIEVAKSPGQLFWQAISLLKQNFPQDLLGDVDGYAEIFSAEEQKEMGNDRVFFLVAKDSRGYVCAVTVMSYLDRPAESTDFTGGGVAYLEYIVVADRARRSKLGSRLFWESIKYLKQEGYSPSAVIAEVAKPDPELEGMDKRSVNNRLKFFRGLAFSIVQGVDYQIPSSTSGREIPAYLAVRPLHEDFNFDLWFFRGVVYALVHDVFKYDREISERRADKLYETIISSIDRKNLRLV